VAGLEFEDFYAAYFRPLTIQLYAYTGDLAGAQDVVQEAFCRVAWNLATSQWRRTLIAGRFLRVQREEHVPEPGPDRVALAAALANLPAQQRRAVILHYLADLPIAEIAAQEGVAEGTVKSWLHRGRAALAVQLAEAGKGAHRG
jgi:RNA polymerase sigma-70 factor (ECF subfamily)